MLSGFFCPPDFNIKCGGDAAVNQYKEYVDYINGVAKEIK
jgi:hypothetical protein